MRILVLVIDVSREDYLVEGHGSIPAGLLPIKEPEPCIEVDEEVRPQRRRVCSTLPRNYHNSGLFSSRVQFDARPKRDALTSTRARSCL